jgi:hypothetical protein
VHYTYARPVARETPGDFEYAHAPHGNCHGSKLFGTQINTCRLYLGVLSSPLVSCRYEGQFVSFPVGYPRLHKLAGSDGRRMWHLGWRTRQRTRRPTAEPHALHQRTRSYGVSTENLSASHMGRPTEGNRLAFRVRCVVPETIRQCSPH